MTSTRDGVSLRLEDREEELLPIPEVEDAVRDLSAAAW
jgi:hypothetical protein